MLQTRRLTLTTATLLLLAGLASGQGTTTLPPPTPVPVVPAGPQLGPLPPPPPPPPSGLVGPLPASIVPDAYPAPSVSPATGVPSYGDQYMPPPGWFANIDFGLVHPSFKNHLQGQVPLPGGHTETVAVPGADLDWTFSPRVEIGYRLPLDLGSIILGYRSLVSEGKSDETDNLGNSGTLKSRLNLNQVDIDYRSMDFDVGGKWNLFWRLGVEFASIYYDSRTDAHLVSTLAGPGMFDARVSNNFLGAGPKAAVEMSRTLFTPRLCFFTNFQGAVLLGNIHQTYEETFNFPSLGRPFGGASDANTFQAVPTLGLQVGLSWTPLGPDALRLSLGYQYEYWWMLGRLGGSRGELESQGVFFRTEFHF